MSNNKKNKKTTIENIENYKKSNQNISTYNKNHTQIAYNAIKKENRQGNVSGYIGHSRRGVKGADIILELKGIKISGEDREYDNKVCDNNAADNNTNLNNDCGCVCDCECVCNDCGSICDTECVCDDCGCVCDIECVCDCECVCDDCGCICDIEYVCDDCGGVCNDCDCVCDCADNICEDVITDNDNNDNQAECEKNYIEFNNTMADKVSDELLYEATQYDESQESDGSDQISYENSDFGYIVFSEGNDDFFKFNDKSTDNKAENQETSSQRQADEKKTESIAESKPKDKLNNKKLSPKSVSNDIKAKSNTVEKSKKSESELEKNEKLESVELENVDKPKKTKEAKKSENSSVEDIKGIDDLDAELCGKNKKADKDIETSAKDNAIDNTCIDSVKSYGYFYSTSEQIIRAGEMLIIEKGYTLLNLIHNDNNCHITIGEDGVYHIAFSVYADNESMGIMINDMPVQDSSIYSLSAWGSRLNGYYITALHKNDKISFINTSLTSINLPKVKGNNFCATIIKI